MNEREKNFERRTHEFLLLLPWIMLTQAVILAGGEGTRLRPVTYEIPKQLILVQGLPIMTWQARWFARYGVKRILVIVAPKWQQAFEQWRQALPRELGLELELWVEPFPMGTLGALAKPLKNKFDGDSIFVTNGDELKGFDLQALAKVHAAQLEQNHDHAATLCLVKVEQPSHYGIPVMDGSRVVRYEEKPQHPSSDFANAGLYALRTVIFQELSFEQPYLMFEKDFFPAMAEAGRLAGCALFGPWFDCGTMERWGKAIHEWQEPSVS